MTKRSKSKKKRRSKDSYNTSGLNNTKPGDVSPVVTAMDIELGNDPVSDVEDRNLDQNGAGRNLFPSLFQSIELQNEPADNADVTEIGAAELNENQFGTDENLSRTTSSISNEKQSHRVLDPNMFLKALRKLKHEEGCRDPIKFTVIDKEFQSGLEIRLKFRCTDCGARTPKPVAVNGKLNEIAVAGGMSAGLGFTGHQKQCASLNIPTMSKETHRVKSHIVGKKSIKLARQNMEKAAALEKQLAIEAGRVSPSGTPLVTVILDGCYCKRSYGTNYSSLSGGACVIGFRTGLILDGDVYNRYCHTCCIYGADREHECSFNYTGPASGKVILPGGNLLLLRIKNKVAS